ncbi:MAG: hypothetical protein HUJ70_12045, partial [Pseudobutyrivibrio sp.]|nr:hypothetical protein [Pseudobutyrivibrio sp.]
MRLSDYKDKLDIEIVRDGEFETLGNCTDELNKTFISFLGKAKFIDKINPNVTCIITTEEIASQIPERIQGVAVAKEPKLEYVRLHNLLAKDEAYVGKSFKTVIGKGCEISPLASIAENNVIIGNNVKIGPFTVVNERVTIKDNVTIREHCVISGKTFNYGVASDGGLFAMEDCGQVVIEEDVDICAFSYVDSCPLPRETTRVFKGAKLGVDIHVGH